jgi:hypothetical protein
LIYLAFVDQIGANIGVHGSLCLVLLIKLFKILLNHGQKLECPRWWLAGAMSALRPAN